MNRREFLKRLGGFVGVTIITPLILDPLSRVFASSKTGLVLPELPLGSSTDLPVGNPYTDLHVAASHRRTSRPDGDDESVTVSISNTNQSKEYDGILVNALWASMDWGQGNLHSIGSIGKIRPAESIAITSEWAKLAGNQIPLEMVLG